MYIHIHIPLIYINISINSHSHLTSTIWSEYVSEQIRPPPPHDGAGSLVLLESDPAKLIRLKKFYVQFCAILGVVW